MLAQILCGRRPQNGDNAARTPTTPQYTVSKVPHWAIFYKQAVWRGTPFSESLHIQFFRTLKNEENDFDGNLSESLETF